jgi:hypothetical protein
LMFDLYLLAALAGILFAGSGWLMLELYRR